MEKKAKRADGSERGTAKRIVDSRRVYAQTGDQRAAIREYCRGKRWLVENCHFRSPACGT